MTTIRDVARAAGVSIATVSRVYSGSQTVNEETSRRVLAAGSRLDYWPNAAARTLTTARTHTLGVLLPDLYGEFFSEVIRGIDQAARQERLQILVSGSHADAETIISVARSMRGRVDGLIVMAPDQTSASALEQLMRVYPMVLLNGPAGFDGCDTISIANFQGAHALLRHLLSLGHRRIALLRGPAGNVDAEDRRQGYRAALREVGLEPDPALEIPGAFTEESGYAAADALLSISPAPSAVFAANDGMAIGLLSALLDRGRRVPQDIAVAGFDDIAAARYLNPPLTTVRVDAFELGRRAVALWSGNGNGKEKRAERLNEVLPVRLVVRGSCGWRPADAGAADRPVRRARAPAARSRSAGRSTGPSAEGRPRAPGMTAP